MTFVQQWATSGAPLTGSVTRTGPATVAGNTLFIDLIIRQNIIPDFTVTDSAGNTGWTLLAATPMAAGSGTLATFYCPNAASVTNVTVAAANSGVPASVAMTFFVKEVTPVGALVASETDSLPSGGTVGPLAVPTGGYVHITGGTSVTTRTWTYAETGMAATQRDFYSGAQVLLNTADAYPSAGNVTVGWTLASGAAIDFVVHAFVFGEAGETVDPENTATVVDVNAAVGWTASAGTVLEAISDGNPVTYITSAEAPDDQLLDVDIAPLLPPDEGQSAVVTLRGIRATAPTSTANVIVMLYNGATLRATSAAMPITTSATDLAITFPSSSIGSVNWLTLRVVVSVTATG